MADVQGNPTIGVIVAWAPNFAPRGWALCNGQLLQISQNQALFSILGTTFGGDGRETFGLPDLRGRVASHPTGTPFRLGTRVGAETVALSGSQVPPHSHPIMNNPVDVQATSNEGDALLPAADLRLAAAKTTTLIDVNLYSDQAPNTTVGGVEVTGNGGLIAQNSGGGQGHANIQPYTALHYIIALQGVYPSRN